MNAEDYHRPLVYHCGLLQRNACIPDFHAEWDDQSTHSISMLPLHGKLLKIEANEEASFIPHDTPP